MSVVASVVSNVAVHLRTKSTLDDTLDVFPCHGVGGMFAASGTISTSNASGPSTRAAWRASSSSRFTPMLKLAATSTALCAAAASINGPFIPGTTTIDTAQGRAALADPACGGCRFQDLAYEAQLDSKAAQVRDALVRIGGIAESATLNAGQW